MGEAAVLSARQVRRSIFFLLAAPVAWTIFGAASTGTLLIGLLRSVEMTKQEIGMVMSLTLIFLPMQLIGTYLQERFLHRKHFWEWCLFVYYSSFLLIAALVMEWGAFPAELAVLIFMLIFGGGQIAAQLQGAIALAWQGEIIPVRESNSFWSRRTALGTIAGMVAGILVGALADWLGRDKRSTYALILVLGAISGYMNLFLLSRVPDPAPRSGKKLELLKIIREILREKNFRKLTAFFSFQNFVGWLMSGFIFVYLQETMKFSQTAIQLLLASSCIVGYFSGFVFSAFGNRYGRKPLLIICSVLKFGEFMLWGTLFYGNNWLDDLGLHLLGQLGIPTGFIPPGFISSLPVFILGGFVNVGLSSGQLSLLTTVGRRDTQGFMIAFFYTIIGLVSAVSSSFSGSLYEYFDQSPLVTETLHLTGFNLLSIIAGIGYFVSIVFIWNYDEHGAAPTVTVVRNMLAHNPFRSIYHAYVLSSPMDESERAATLRSAKGGLFDSRIVEGLCSPSGLVRESALENIAIQHESSDPELIDELIRLLDDRKFGMRQQAAKLLGRIGGDRAAAALTARFDAPDIDFANACIYAAGFIRNPASAPQLIRVLDNPERFDSHAAAAEALSRIGGYEYAEYIFRAYENENDWILSRQCMVSLCRTMLPSSASSLKYFEAELSQSGSQIELLLKDCCRLIGKPLHFEKLIAEYELHRYAELFGEVLTAELHDCGIPLNDGETLERLFSGANRFREPRLNESSYEMTSLRMQLKLWSYLRYEGESADSLKLLGALIIAHTLQMRKQPLAA